MASLIMRNVRRSWNQYNDSKQRTKTTKSNLTKWKTDRVYSARLLIAARDDDKERKRVDIIAQESVSNTECFMCALDVSYFDVQVSL